MRDGKRDKRTTQRQRMSVSNIPLKKRLALKLHKRYRANEIKIHQLNYIFWECTLRCNLNCIHCGSDCMKDSSIKDMPEEDFFQALDEITPIISPNKTMIVLTGGEPILRKDISEIGKELYRRGFPWGVVSNGMGMQKSMIAKLLQSGIRAMTISLDGLEDSHNWLRGNKNSFKHAVDAISILSGQRIYPVEWFVKSQLDVPMMFDVKKEQKIIIS